MHCQRRKDRSFIAQQTNGTLPNASGSDILSGWMEFITFFDNNSFHLFKKRFFFLFKNEYHHSFPFNEILDTTEGTKMIFFKRRRRRRKKKKMQKNRIGQLSRFNGWKQRTRIGRSGVRNH